MTDFANRFFTDHDREEEGVWVDFGQGLEVKIRRSDSRRSRDVFRRLYKPYRKMEEAGNPIPHDDEILIRAKWTAQALVADWKGVTDRKGKAVKYDSENLKAAIDLLVDARDFQKLINDFADEQETFRAATVEAAAKNSPAPSGSTS